MAFLSGRPQGIVLHIHRCAPILWVPQSATSNPRVSRDLSQPSARRRIRYDAPCRSVRPKIVRNKARHQTIADDPNFSSSIITSCEAHIDQLSYLVETDAGARVLGARSSLSSQRALPYRRSGRRPTPRQATVAPVSCQRLQTSFEFHSTSQCWRSLLIDDEHDPEGRAELPTSGQSIVVGKTSSQCGLVATHHGSTE